VRVALDNHGRMRVCPDINAVIIRYLNKNTSLDVFGSVRLHCISKGRDM